MEKRRTETGNESLSIEQYKDVLKSLKLKPYEGKAKKVERYFETFGNKRR